MKSFIRIALAALGAASIAAGPAAAATFKVASSGTDSGTCGAPPNAPCLTIQQAVDNAAAGDSIQVGPGSYAGAVVSKKLKLWSSNGTGGAQVVSQMTLASDGIVFGLLGKGFALDNTASPLTTAILVLGSEVTVRGNRLNSASICVAVNGDQAIVRDNTFNGCTNFGVQVNGDNAQVRGNVMGYSGSGGVLLNGSSAAADVRENRMFGPSGTGIMIDGADHLVRRNVIQGSTGGISSVPTMSGGNPTGVQLVENVVSSQSFAYALSSGSGWVLTRNAAIAAHAPGFYLTAGTTFTLTGNVAIGDVAYGIFIQSGSGHTLVDNTAINTIDVGSTSGIALVGVGPGVTISGGNLYGNGDNCGVYNDMTSSPVTADKVFWGAASGPGIDPADATCGGGTVTVTNPASKPAVIKIPPLK